MLSLLSVPTQQTFSKSLSTQQASIYPHETQHSPHSRHFEINTRCIQCSRAIAHFTPQANCAQNICTHEILIADIFKDNLQKHKKSAINWNIYFQRECHLCTYLEHAKPRTSHISCEMESSRRAGKVQTRINLNEQLYQTQEHLSTSTFTLNSCMVIWKPKVQVNSVQVPKYCWVLR